MTCAKSRCCVESNKYYLSGVCLCLVNIMIPQIKHSVWQSHSNKFKSLGRTPRWTVPFVPKKALGITSAPYAANRVTASVRCAWCTGILLAVTLCSAQSHPRSFTALLRHFLVMILWNHQLISWGKMHGGHWWNLLCRSNLNLHLHLHHQQDLSLQKMWTQQLHRCY